MKLSRPPDYGKLVMSEDEIPAIFDLAFTVRLFRQGYHTIVKKCERGELPALKFGREWRLRKTDILKYMEEQSNCHHSG